MYRSILALSAVLLTAGSTYADEGVVCDNKIVPAQTAAVYYESFTGGQYGGVGIKGDGSTDLDLFVYDMDGNLIASDTGWSDKAVLTWFVDHTQTYKIRVTNRGYVFNRYRICLN